LLSSISHDIRTPLAGIAGASSTLASSFETLPAEVRSQLLDTINTEADRLARLVENLLHMTRLSSGKIEIVRDWHPLEDVIGSALNRLDSRLVEHRIEVRVDEPVLLAKIDPVLVEQLIVNLVENAIKYSPASSAIEILAHGTATGVELIVADRGPGFIPGEEERVFDLFFRGGHEAHDRRGTGIGLAICRAVAEVHGGRVEASNRPGGGAQLRVIFAHPEPPPVITEETLE
jgi:two-component system sensor histidine kinase KdpD